MHEEWVAITVHIGGTDRVGKHGHLGNCMFSTIRSVHILASFHLLSEFRAKLCPLLDCASSRYSFTHSASQSSSFRSAELLIECLYSIT